MSSENVTFFSEFSRKHLLWLYMYILFGKQEKLQKDLKNLIELIWIICLSFTL